jgi:hypothetical protein
MPTPTPTRNWPTKSIIGPFARVLVAAPIPIIIMSTSINRLRPRRSATGPPNPAPKTAPSTRAAPMRPTTSEVIWNSAMVSGIATPRAKMTKPSSNVPPVESTQSHRWIGFSGEPSSSDVRRCDGVISTNVNASCAGPRSLRSPRDDIHAEFQLGLPLVWATACSFLPFVGRGSVRSPNPETTYDSRE